MAKLISVQLMHRAVEFFQQLQTSRGNASLDHSAVFRLPLPGDETVFLHAIKEAGDVRVSRDHAFADAAAQKTAGLRAAQDAKNVVLRGVRPAVLIRCSASCARESAAFKM